MSFVENCRRLISIDSTISHGGAEAVLFAGELCRDAGLDVEYQVEVLNGKEERNVIARYGEARPDEEFLMQTHLDTAEPGIYALWTETQSNPFNASIYGDQMVGLGTADAKLDFICKLEAAKYFKDKKMRLPFVLLGTFGQQSGMVGAVKALRKSKVKAKKAIIGHPTGLNLIHASAGFATVEINVPFSEEETAYHAQHDLALSSSTQSKIFYGKSAYSAYPILGENAIVKMLEHLVQLPEGIAIMDIDGGTSHNSIPDSAVIELDFVGSFKGKTVSSKIVEILEVVKRVESEFVKYPSIGFDPNIPTLNIGKVKKFKDHIRLMGCCHLTPAVDQEVYEEWMRTIKETCERVGASFRVLEYKQPFEGDIDSKFSKECMLAISEHHGDSIFSKSMYCTEANVFSRLGIESLVFGPGKFSENAFCANEKISINELKKTVEIYKSIISRICL